MTITLLCESNTFKYSRSASQPLHISSHVCISFVTSPNHFHPLQSFIHKLNSLWPYHHPTFIHAKHMPLLLYSLFKNFMVSHFNILLLHSMSESPHLPPPGQTMQPMFYPAI